MITRQNTVIKMEEMMDRRIPLATLAFTPSRSLAPYFWETTTEKPEDTPWAKPVVRNMIVPVEPTAANAPAPTNRPTMMVSTML